MNRDGSLVSIGECMVELARGGDGRFGLAYGGDTFNTAVYAARMGARVAYATALGDDAYSAGIAAVADGENVDVSLVPRCEGRMPGLYMIETSATGERAFFYWRDRSPARELFEMKDAAADVAVRMRGAAVCYFSGITLSLYSDAGLDSFENALREARGAGAKIVFDGNFRSRGWPDRERARRIFTRFLSICDIALPTFDDEQMLWSDATPADAIARLGKLGVKEIAVKNGPEGADVFADDATTHVPTPARVQAIDTTAAGDSFNAAYIAARLRGAAPIEAALTAHRLAAIVIRHRGAIAPKDATRDIAALISA